MTIVWPWLYVSGAHLLGVYLAIYIYSNKYNKLNENKKNIILITYCS